MFRVTTYVTASPFTRRGAGRPPPRRPRRRRARGPRTARPGPARPAALRPAPWPARRRPRPCRGGGRRAREVQLGRGDFAAGGPAVVACQAAAVGPLEHGGGQGRIDPALEVARRNSGYSASRGTSARPRASVAARSASIAGHGASGFTWSGVTGETPPQSLMPGVQQPPEVCVGQVRRALEVPVRAEHDARRRDRPAQLVERRAPGGPPCGVPGLARKFWTMTSCTWPWRSPSARSSSSASIRSARVSPIPIRSPLVNGHRSLARGRDRRQPDRRVLVRGAEVGPPRSPSRLDAVSSMIPIEADTGAARAGPRASARPG